MLRYTIRAKLTCNNFFDYVKIFMINILDAISFI